ncbi:MAG TPA: hypothetical protein PKO33_05640 [Pyrinomonadaceae bacterium]|nr:hypothetical protein [Pyrinomonadaceae bacterium]
MDDEIAMGVIDGRAQLGEDLQDLDQAWIRLAAIGVEGDAFDILHHKIRSAVVGYSAVDHPRNVGVLECSENPSFACKSFEDRFRVHPALDEFQRE